MSKCAVVLQQPTFKAVSHLTPRRDPSAAPPGAASTQQQQGPGAGAASSPFPMDGKLPSSWGKGRCFPIPVS